MDNRLTLYFHARILTMRPERPRAGAILIGGGRVLALFDEPEPDLTITGVPIDRVDLEGRCLLPGLNDTHLHLLDWGMTLDDLPLGDCATTEDIISRVAKRAATLAPGRLVTGRGWLAAKFEGGQGPTKREYDALNAATPHHPVVLHSACWHQALVNEAMLALAGGSPHRDASRPAGLLLEKEIGAVGDRLPAPTEADWDAAFLRAQDACREFGVTGVHQIARSDEPMETWERLARQDRAGKMLLRTRYYFPGRMVAEAEGLGLAPQAAGPGLSIAGLKWFADGSLGGRTARMTKPYTRPALGDEAGLGMFTIDAEKLKDEVVRSAKLGLSPAVHAIGDAALDIVLDAYEAARAVAPDLTLRVEHAQTCRPDQAKRMAQLAVWAMMQPVHLLDDIYTAPTSLPPELAAATHASGMIRDAGVRIALGSDAPVSPPSVSLSLHAAVVRAPLGRSSFDAFHREHALTVAHTLIGHTVAAAQVAGDVHERGWLGEGAVADIAILDRDPTEMHPDQLQHLRVAGCRWAGEPAWRPVEKVPAQPRRQGFKGC